MVGTGGIVAVMVGGMEVVGMGVENTVAAGVAGV